MFKARYAAILFFMLSAMGCSKTDEVEKKDTEETYVHHAYRIAGPYLWHFKHTHWYFQGSYTLENDTTATLMALDSTTLVFQGDTLSYANTVWTVGKDTFIYYKSEINRELRLTYYKANDSLLYSIDMHGPGQGAHTTYNTRKH